ASLADNINSHVNEVIDQLTNFAGLHTEATKLRRDVIRVAKNINLIPARATDVTPISAPAPSNDELPELVLNALGTVPTNLDDMIFVSKNKKKLPSDQDRKSTRLNSSHVSISYAVFCLKKKKNFDND